MHVFVYEHLCATTSPDAPAALLAEGQAMLAAVVGDMQRCAEVEVATLGAAGKKGVRPLKKGGQTPFLPAALIPTDRHPAPDNEEAFRRLARAADWSLVIAPECGGCLARYCRWVEEEGGQLLGPSSAAVALTADKLALSHHLRARSIPSPPCFALTEVRAGPFPLVCKPRDGAGAQATFLVHDENELAAAIAAARDEGWTGELIVQPFVTGAAVSVAFLAGPAQRMALPAARQALSTDGRFHYRGGSLPLPAEEDGRARRLAERAVASVPGLAGYFGVDLVLGESADGSQDQVIEINPRLTTSYLGLRRLARFNLAEVLLTLAQGKSVAGLRWHPGPRSFQV